MIRRNCHIKYDLNRKKYSIVLGLSLAFGKKSTLGDGFNSCIEKPARAPEGCMDLKFSITLKI